jgi:hypothetical protein
MPAPDPPTSGGVLIRGRAAVASRVIIRSWWSVSVWVREDHLRPLTLEQAGIGGRVDRVAADEPVPADLPEVGRPGHGRPIAIDAGDLVGGIGLIRRSRRALPADQDVDLGGLETRNGHIKIEIDAGQVLQLDGEDVPIPPRLLGELVVGEDVGALLVFAARAGAPARSRARVAWPP